MSRKVDAVVVGSGPNGLAAAIELAQAGRSVRVLERADTIGGGMRTAEVTRPGFRHDICSAIHPLVAGSPFLSSLGLEREGLELRFPPVQAAHPLPDGSAVALYRSIDQTAEGLGLDGESYRALLEPLARRWFGLAATVLGPPRVPRELGVAARFGWRALRPATALARSAFRGERARALLAGMSAHAIRPLNEPGTAAFGLVLMTLGHAVGWPVARGGSQTIANALAARLQELGGEIHTAHDVRSLRDVPADAKAVLFDVTPRQLVSICGAELPLAYRAALGFYRYGAGVWKVDYALSGPVPWHAAECRQAGTVHLGGTLEQIASAEAQVARGGHPERPYVLIAQPGVVDASRAPEGQHTLWSYCHVPNGSTVDMTAAIQAQIERAAPGFSDLVLARATRGPAEMQHENPNYIGGDINGGAATLRQIAARPVPSLNPYATPNPRLFLCSSSTPPGGGVHGMCGYHAARSALRGVLR
jgi:phytoene dehydrogenase-like protein